MVVGRRLVPVMVMMVTVAGGATVAPAQTEYPKQSRHDVDGTHRCTVASHRVTSDAVECGLRLPERRGHEA